MTTRLEVLDMISQSLSDKLGQDRVARRPDGIVILAGNAEAFAVQVLTIDVPDGVSPEDFGRELVRHIERGTTSAH